MLKTRIEEITARGLSPVLPLDMLIPTTSPTISVNYVDQISVTAFTNLNFDFSYLKDIVDAAAGKANKYSAGFAAAIANYLKDLSAEIEKNVNEGITKLNNKVNEGVQKAKDATNNAAKDATGKSPINYIDEKNVTRTLSEFFGSDTKKLVAAGMEFNAFIGSLVETSKENERIAAATPKSYDLAMETVPYAGSNGGIGASKAKDVVLATVRPLW